MRDRASAPCGVSSPGSAGKGGQGRPVLASSAAAVAVGARTPWREIGVLVRDNAHAADVFDTLTARGVPVEIVGLTGLLRLPEVREVLATLTLIDDLTANAELLTLLTGVATPQSWTSDVFTTGFLLVPVLAATLLRPRV